MSLMLESSVVKMHCETALYRCFYPVLVRSDGHATGHFLQWEAGRISMCTCLMDMQTYMHIYIYMCMYIYKVHMIIYIYIQCTCIDTMCAWIVCIYIICMYIYILYNIHDILHVTKYLRAPLKASLVHSLSPENWHGTLKKNWISQQKI